MITSQALWLCEECRSTVKSRSLSELLSANEIITQIKSFKSEMAKLKEQMTTLSEAIGDCTANLQSGISQLERKVEENNCRLDAALDKAKQNDVFIPGGSGYSGVRDDLSAKRNQRDYSGGVVGTGEVDLNGLSVPSLVATAEPEQFWLYLSGFHRQVTSEDVSKVVRCCLHTESEAKVVMLVPKNVDMSRLTFISFKVGLPVDLKDAALLPSTWPQGIRFREFENKPAKNHRRLSSATT